MFSLCQGVIRDVLVKIKAGIPRLIKYMKDENFINELPTFVSKKLPFQLKK